MQSYWVHLNRVHKYARIHRADCTFCDGGKGLHGRGSDAVASRWLGPFDSFAKAAAAGEATGKPLSNCAVCAPNP